jgi:hypothetical protein
MKTKNYTPDGQHPEDAIFKVKTFINELQSVQEEYFIKLVRDLNLTKEGEDWLFDYVYNTKYDENYDGFEHYLENFKKKYDDMVFHDTMYNESVDALLPTDFGEFSPMFHMSSYESDLETAFPPAYNDNEPISLGLDTITVNNQNAQSDNQI